MVELSILGFILVVFTIGLAVGVVVAVGMLFFIQVSLHFVSSAQFIWIDYFSDIFCCLLPFLFYSNLLKHPSCQIFFLLFSFVFNFNIILLSINSFTSYCFFFRLISFLYNLYLKLKQILITILLYPFIYNMMNNLQVT